MRRSLRALLLASTLTGLGLTTVVHAAAGTGQQKAKTTALVDVTPARAALLKAHPGADAAVVARIDLGLKQVQRLWRVNDDGDASALRDFAVQHFVVGDDRERTFHRLERALEIVDGHMLEIGRDLRAPTELDLPAFNPTVAVDGLLAGWDASAHVLDDAFATKLAFVALLNFPQSTLGERLERAATMQKRDWAEARLTERYAARIPATVLAAQAKASADADAYIANYNLWMHHILGPKGERLFPKGKRLISHWNLRDELKAQYANGVEGTMRQRTIVKLMERIVTQEIPAAVIDAPWVDYNPFTNTLTDAPADTVEKARPTTVAAPTSMPELDRELSRYQQLLAQFHAARAVDPYTPLSPTAMQRSFEGGRQLTEARVKALFLEVLSAPQVKEVAAVIERRLGRPLEPQDLWYDGFKARAAISEAKLDGLTRTRYPDADAFKRDLPRMLKDLGFDKKTSAWLASHIAVDPARGAGHALEAARRDDVPHLRTRIEPGGMDYKGYNIAVHELGHNVEQLFSLHKVESTLLQGVPANAFTEAIAFVFQARDLELLGLQKPSAAQKHEAVLNDFWSTWEIAGVALVDVAVWHWLYEHPDATPAQLRDATTRIASDLWKTWYAPVLGAAGKTGSVDGEVTPLLGIYSHMIAYPLYLSDYPIGHLIALQIEEQVERAQKKGVPLGKEIERMASIGAVAPDVWMRTASGEPVSAGPLLRATSQALASLPDRQTPKTR